MIIGLTGKNCAGKGETAEYFKEIGFQYTSLSDVIREEMRAADIEITRANLIKFANNLRTNQGPDYLAVRCLEKITDGDTWVVDSIRNPAEVATLRRNPNFRLLCVDADPKIRFERMKSRNREGDPQNLEDFLSVEAAEAGSKDPNTQQLNQVGEMADAVLFNNGDREELHSKVDDVIKTLRTELEESAS